MDPLNHSPHSSSTVAVVILHKKLRDTSGAVSTWKRMLSGAT
jgi:hypothetical protein